MAVTTKATAISNRDSTPAVLNNAAIGNSRLHEAVGTVEAGSGDGVGSKYLFASVPSNARISRVLLSCDAITSTGAVDVGLYKTTAAGGAAVDADFFASAQAVTSALKNSDITHESGVFDIDDVEKPLWKALGLDADPNIFYDVVATLTTDTGGAGTLSLKVQYVI